MRTWDRSSLTPEVVEIDQSAGSSRSVDPEAPASPEAAASPEDGAQYGATRAPGTAEVPDGGVKPEVAAAPGGGGAEPAMTADAQADVPPEDTVGLMVEVAEGQIFRVAAARQRVGKYASGAIGDVSGRLMQRSSRMNRFVTFDLMLFPRITLDELGTHAGSVTYGALFSIPPLLMLAVSGLGFVLAEQSTAEQWVFDKLVDLVPGLEIFLPAQLEYARSGRFIFVVAGLLGLVWTATGLASRVRHALGVIHGTDVTGLTSGRVGALVAQVPIGFALLLLVLVAGGASALTGSGKIGPLPETAVYVLIFAVGALFWTSSYRLLTPRNRLRFVDFIPGGVLFAAAFALLERLGAWYVQYIGARYTSLYGAIGAFLALLAFIYLVSYAFLLGAEVNQVLLDMRRGRTTGSSQ
jgi:uncharacterized BrkB/YihY/UPF0761 family membrane protein